MLHRPYKEPPLWRVGLSLIGLWFGGWRSVPGYTCLNRDDPWKGALYVAIALTNDKRRTS